MMTLRRLRKACLEFIPLILKTAVLRTAPAAYNVFEIKPTSATVLVTNLCNLRCIMCRQWKEPSQKELKYDDWITIMMDLKKNGIRNIHFSGGEPLLRRDLEDIISNCVSLGMTVGMTTNGTLLDQKRLENLVAAGIRSIAVSLDATGEEYESIRGVKGAYNKASGAICMVAKLFREKKIDAYVNFTLMKNNLKALRSVKKFTDGEKIPLAICLLDGRSSIFNLEENRSKLWINSDAERKELDEAITFLRSEKIKAPRSLIMNFPGLDYIKAYFKDTVQKQIPCVSSQNRVVIDPFGNIMGGCMSMGVFGNIKDSGFRAVISQKKYKFAKKNMFYKKCPGCSCGYLFNIMTYFPMLVKDLWARLTLR